jgi:hypothetical protein
LVEAIQGKAHRDIFSKDGSWHEGDWFTRPGGVQNVTVNGKSDIYPSWYTKPANAEGTKVQFDSVTKKKATSCTPERAKVELTVQVFEDPVSKNKTYTSPDGYDANAEDDLHKCDDIKPFVSVSKQKVGGNYKITASVSQGTHALSSVDIAVDGQVVSSQSVGAAGDYSVSVPLSSGSHTVSATVIDVALYDASDTEGPFNVAFSGGGPVIVFDRRR